jgi:hypothetical protein
MNIFTWIRLILSAFQAIKDKDKLQDLILTQTAELDIADEQVALKTTVLNIRAVVKDDEAFEHDYLLVAGMFGANPQLVGAMPGAFGDWKFMRTLLDFLQTIDWKQFMDLFVNSTKALRALDAIERNENARELFLNTIDVQFAAPVDDDEALLCARNTETACRAQQICDTADDPDMDPFTILAIISLITQAIKFWRDRRNA